jgi:poly-beta-hydroxybutyrate-responsive repressor
LLDEVNDLLFAASPVDAGAIYRTLRRMEREKLVRSRWNTAKSGPAKRIYRITRNGEERLHGWVVNLKKRKQALEKFLKLYEGR